MISDKEIEILTERLVSRLQHTNTNILIEIANCIKEVGEVIPSRALQLANFLKYGGNFNKIIEELARMTRLSVKDIYDMLDLVARENYAFAEEFYKYNNKEYIPYEENLALQETLNAMARNTVDNFTKYLSVSPTGFSTRVIGYDFVDINGNRIFEGLKATYERVIDEAVLNVHMGKESFETAMANTMKQLGGSGLKYVEYESGIHRRLDSAIRMNIKDAISQLSNTIQQQFGKEFGSDGIEISVHNNCAKDHLDIQGHQFTLQEYNKLQNHMPFEDVDGKKYDAKERAISEYNCRHYIFSIVVGVSKPQYSKEQLQSIVDKNNQLIKYQGKEYTGYELTQMQRQLETKLRKWKDINKMAKASSNTKLLNASKSKISQYFSEYEQLCKKAKLEPYYERIR